MDKNKRIMTHFNLRIMMLTVFMSMVSVKMMAAYNFDIIDGIRYRFDTSNNTAAVLENTTTPYSGDIIIPPSVLYNSVSYQVTEIEEKAFQYTTLTSVTIPSSVTAIGNKAFKNCSGLTAVTLGDGLTYIGEYAFYKCTSLTSITIPNSVKSIDFYAFSECI